MHKHKDHPHFRRPGKKHDHKKNDLHKEEKPSMLQSLKKSLHDILHHHPEVKKDFAIVKIKVNTFKNQVYAFSNASARIFYCNAITFVNQGTGNAVINDIFQLVPGAALIFKGNQDEIDTTVYKIGFVPGASINLLNAWVKEDAGMNLYDRYPRDAFYTKDIDKRLTDMIKNGEGAHKGEKNNKWNDKDRGDF
jgi:hypothetical protein